uniref:Natural cytotoxicity triggering receptor 1 n=2 Tax=Cavia porcellus TaxID=10141 RepID=H0UVY6_CAVPO|nr:natural cytotoxicity triggering receptor 1 isoform X1 [Cavia porcellus]
MWTALAALLYLGLCQSWEVSTRKRESFLPSPVSLSETLCKPIIWAEPSAVVEKGTPVTIWCQGAADAEEFQLYLEGALFALETPKPPRLRYRVHILIPAMSSRTAGQYSCSYRSGESWSEASDALDLVVTGMYDTPTLWVHPGPQVTPGEPVTLYCRLEIATSMFVLLKEGRPHRVQHGRGPVQAEFPLGPVTAAHQGAYRCFGSYNSHAWSFPSKAVELLIEGDGNTSFIPTDPTPAAAHVGEHCPGSEELGVLRGLDLSAQNLLRLGLAFLVLLALALLLAEDCRGGRRAEAGARGARREARRPQRGGRDGIRAA